MDQPTKLDAESKDRQLEPAREHQEGEYLTTNQGLRVEHTDDSLKAGARGPTLLEDFHFREKITHFDHERIPERVVHARGMGAHGYFQVYESLADITRAAFLQDPAVQTPVFVRFSTVAGSRGSADTPRDARGFATKFYTSEGVFDLVGNNIPVFFIQDAIKFPDIIHAVKPEPHNEIPQAASAHNNFWDFISLTPEAMHMIMWVMSDRALPRSARMMEGFGVNTYRLVNEQGHARFVKFHWKPLLGVHSLLWDESQKLSGKDADWLRRDLWDAIETGAYPEWEFGLQLIEEADELKFDFDVLDATKLWPEELVPVRRVGKLVLNRNPDNFFAETEQVAFHPGHVVPGIDFSNDPLLQGRLFSYLDTQLTRIGPNFAELPINQPLAPVHNNQQDGFMRHRIKSSSVNYFPNSLGGGCPMMAPESMGGYVSYPEKVEGRKIRERSESFKDHFSQATMFWNSQSPPEKEHIVQALQFELSMVESKEVRTRMVGLLGQVDGQLAAWVAQAIGVAVPTLDGAPAKPAKPGRIAPELSMANTVKNTIQTRRVAVVATDGFNSADVTAVKKALTDAGAQVLIVSRFLGTLRSAEGTEVEVDKTFLTGPSVTFDAVFIPGGAAGIATLLKIGDAVHFVNEAFKHCKPIAATGDGLSLLTGADFKGLAGQAVTPDALGEQGILLAQDGADLDEFAARFIKAIGEHRFWTRAQKDLVPA
ncbi:MAG: catalase [Chloroflexia bacterium]